MKQLKIILTLTIANLIRILISVAMGRHVNPILIGLSVGIVVLIGVLISLRMRSIEKELSQRLEGLASFRRIERELGHRIAGLQASILNSPTPNVTPISMVNGVWVVGPPVSDPVVSNPKEPEQGPPPESRFARILRDNYPL